MITIVHREPTPNPNAFKFRTSKMLLDGDLRLGFNSEADAAVFPLASGLFETGSVTAVMIAEDFVSVSADAWADWDALQATVADLLPSFDFAVAKELAEKQKAAAQAHRDSAGPNELLAQVNELIDTYVRPALAGDGGGLDVLGVDEDKIVTVRYQGACGSCPSATAGTIMAIENMLRTKIDPEISVQPL